MGLRAARAALWGHHEAGQALVEFALIAPVLTLVLAGVAYCGGLVIQQQGLAVAARHVARTAALDATLEGLRRGSGELSTESSRVKALRASLGQMVGVSTRGVRWGNLSTRGPGKLKQLSGYDAALVAQTTIQVGSQSYKAGLGVMYTGVSISKDLSRDLSPVGRLASLMGGGLTNMAGGQLSSTSVMPMELPPKARGGVGVLDLNPWIGGILADDKEE